MSGDYEKLVSLASEIGAPSTPEKVGELNVLLSRQSVEAIKKEHFVLFDDLISILVNTNNLHIEFRESIIALQNAIRSE